MQMYTISINFYENLNVNFKKVIIQVIIHTMEAIRSKRLIIKLQSYRRSY